MAQYMQAASIGASLLGGLMGKSSASKAAKAQEAATQAAIAEQRRQYDQTREDQMPWLNTGSSAINRLGYLLGLGSPVEGGKTRDQLIEQYRPQFTSNSSTQGAWHVGPDGKTYDLSNYKHDPNNPYRDQIGVASESYGAGRNFDYLGFKPLSTSQGSTDMSGLNAYVDNLINGQTANADGQYGSLTKSFGLDNFNKDPGYQFRLDEGQKSLDRAQSARGNFLSGAAIKASNRFNQDYATGEYQNSYNRYNNDQTTLYNRLSGVSGAGQNSSNTLANVGANTSGSIADLLTQGGNARAAGIIQGSNAMNQGLSSIGSLFGSSQYGPQSIKWNQGGTTNYWGK